MTTDKRYIDLVTPPEHRTAGGRDWYLRTLHDSSGAVLVVNLHDSNGGYVREFDSTAACEAWLVDSRGRYVIELKQIKNKRNRK